VSTKIRLEELEGNKFIESAHDRRYNCIFCEDDKYHMYISTTKMVYHCFKCEASGKLIDSSKSIDNYEESLRRWFNKEDLEEATYITDIARGTYPTKKSAKIIKSLPRSVLVLSKWKGEYKILTLDPYTNYLQDKRGLTIEEIFTNSIYKSRDMTGVYSGCIIFPVWSGINKNDAEVDYFVCRKIKPKEGESKYINAPWPKDGILYSPANQKKSSILVVVEGAFDAIRTARVANVVALLGKKATTQQLEAIINRVKYPWNNAPKEIRILLDPEAFSSAVKLQLELRTMSELMGWVPYIQICTLPRGVDPGSASEKLLKEALGL